MTRLPASRGHDWRAVWVVVLLSLPGPGCEAPPVEASAAGAPAEHSPAGRIITLAPHLTELVFSAGAGSRLVGVVEYSDYPAAAAGLPRVGDAFRLDYEIIAGLAPDLILAWRSGNPRDMQDRLRQLGYRVVALEPEGLEDVAEHLRAIGKLAGTEKAAGAAAAEYEAKLDRLRLEYGPARPIRVFYQVSDRPWLTVSRQHVIGQAIELCGGVNVFAELPGLTPAVGLEAVLDATPDVIIVGSYDAVNQQKLLSRWKNWSSVPAVSAGNLYLVNADLLSRPGVRLLKGIEQLCERLQEVTAGP